MLFLIMKLFLYQRCPKFLLILLFINNFIPDDDKVGIQTVPDIILDVSITNNVTSDNTTVVSVDIDIINNFMCVSNGESVGINTNTTAVPNVSPDNEVISKKCCFWRY